MADDTVAKKFDQWLFAVTFAAAMSLVALLTFVPVASNDTMIQIKVGEWIWNRHEIPPTLFYPFTEARDYPFHAHEWLPSVVFYLLNRVLDFYDLMFVQGAIGIGLFLGCYAFAVHISGDRTKSLVLAMLTLAVSNYRFYFRPELFALAFVLLSTFFLVRFRSTQQWRYLAWVCVAYVFWINSHGSFLVAFVLVGLFMTGEAVDGFISTIRSMHGSPHSALVVAARAARPYAAALSAMLALSVFNPEGYSVLVFPFVLMESTAAKRYIGEWMPTFSVYFAQWPAFFLYLFFVAFALVVMIRSRKRLGTTEWLVVGAFFVLSTTRNRHITFFAYASVFALAFSLRNRAYPDSARSHPTSTAALLLALLGSIALVIEHGNFYQAYPHSTPNVWMTEFTREKMETTVSGPVLNSMELGGEIIYRYYPRIQPGIDTRIDSYGDHYFAEWQQMFTDEVALNRFIERYDVKFMLLLPSDFESVRNMPSITKAGWRNLWSDQKTVLIRR